LVASQSCNQRSKTKTRRRSHTISCFITLGLDTFIGPQQTLENERTNMIPISIIQFSAQLPTTRNHCLVG